MTAVARKATDGVVRHPLSGRVEFTSTDHGLAEKIAADLDEHAPVTEAYVYETLSAVPRVQRAEWVMPTRVYLAVRRLGDPRAPFWAPLPSREEPAYLVGLPVVIDDDAEGLSLRAVSTAEQAAS